jgi:uncharacterized protein (TIGR03067 family)
MKAVRAVWGAPLVFFLTGWAAERPDSLTVKDLQGTWKGARFTEGTGDKPAQGVKVEFTFKDNTLSGRKDSSAPIGEATYTLSSDGRMIDATGTSGGYRGKVYLGILKLEGGTLTWCTTGAGNKDQTRPGSFVANPGQAHYLIVLTRQK